MVSLKDIATRCGVSIATVSKALNGQQDIGTQTRERILKTADEMGYLTNAAARALKTNRTYNIGVLFVDDRHSGLAHEYFSKVIDSLRLEAENQGYDITFINKNVGKKPTTYLQHCRYRAVDGVVITSAIFTDPMVTELVQSELPVVTIDHVFNDRMAVLSDNVEGEERLARYAIERGHRKIAFIHGEMTSVTKNRLVGFYRAMEDAGIEVPNEYLKETDYHDAMGSYHATEELLALEERPTCILYPDDFSYIGGMNAITDAGLKVPDDVSVMGYDGVGLSRVLSPVLTTWRQDTDRLGKVAMNKLISLIEHPKTTVPETSVVSGSFQEGASVRRLS